MVYFISFASPLAPIYKLFLCPLSYLIAFPGQQGPRSPKAPAGPAFFSLHLPSALNEYTGSSDTNTNNNGNSTNDNGNNKNIKW